MSVPHVDECSDEDLMLAYARGRTDAFEALYARHRKAVYRYVIRHCGNGATADELFQDVWMNLIRARGTYTPTAQFSTWLYTLAHHRLVDHWRASGLVRAMSMDGDDDVDNTIAAIPAPGAHTPEHLFGNRQVGERLHAALACLPPVQRDAFLLQQESGLSLAEIAALTGVGVETVKSRLRYAVAKLRATLGELREALNDER
jgi:RNA polymerase sigma-70 factor, ECF subfamily